MTNACKAPCGQALQNHPKGACQGCGSTDKEHLQCRWALKVQWYADSLGQAHVSYASGNAQAHALPAGGQLVGSLKRLTQQQRAQVDMLRGQGKTPEAITAGESLPPAKRHAC